MRGPSLSSANKQEIMIRHRLTPRANYTRRIFAANSLCPSPPRLHKVNQAPSYASHMSCTSFCLVTLVCSLAMLRSFLKTAFATPCRSVSEISPRPSSSSVVADRRAGKTRAPDQARAHAPGAAAPPGQMPRPRHAWPCTRRIVRPLAMACANAKPPLSKPTPESRILHSIRRSTAGDVRPFLRSRLAATPHSMSVS